MKKRSSVVEGNTPGKPASKHTRCVNARKCLFGNDGAELKENEQKAKNIPWSLKEEVSLVQYICLYWPDSHTDLWPKHKNNKFWDDCASSVNNLNNSNRTGASCSTRVLKNLSKKFPTLSDAEEALNINYVEDQPETPKTPPQHRRQQEDIESCLSPIFGLSPGILGEPSIGDTLKAFVSLFKLSKSQRMKGQLLNHLFKLFVVDTYDLDFFKFVQRDFLNVSLDGMRALYEEGKHNIVHGLSKCFNKQPGDNTHSCTRMPMNRMPYGLMDYNVRFFASEYTQKLGVEEHYAKWIETMYSHFGHKWVALHRGPGWQYDIEEQEEEDDEEQQKKDKNSCSNLIEDALALSGLTLSEKDGNGDGDGVQSDEIRVHQM